MSQHAMRSRQSRRARATAIATVAVLLALGSAFPSSAASVPGTRDVTNAPLAAAAEPFEIPIRWETGALRTTYGDYWSFTFYTDSGFYYDPAGVVEIDGPLSDFAADAVIVSNIKAPDSASDVIAYLNPPFSVPPLSAGSYQFSPRLRWTFSDQPFVGEPASPATLTIDPAALRVDSRVQQDSNNPVVTVISAALTGEYIDEWAWTSSYPDVEPGYARVPGGTWRIVVTDDEGTTVVDETVDRQEGAVPSTTLAIADLPRDTTLSATATFTLDAASAGNFTVAQAESFAFTTPAEGRPILVVDDETLDEVAIMADPEPTVPVGVIAMAGLIALGLATTVVVQVVRLRRARLGGVTSNGKPDPAQVDDPKTAS